jgi:hypothetical protein
MSAKVSPKMPSVERITVESFGILSSYPRAYRHEDFDWALSQFRVDAHTLNHSRLNAIDANRRPSLQTRSPLEVRLQVLVAGLWLPECEPSASESYDDDEGQDDLSHIASLKRHSDTSKNG